MAKLIWALLCRRIILDRETNLVSYVDAVDGMSLPKFPLPAPLFFVGTTWARGDDDKLEMNVVVYGPNGRRIDEAEADPLTFERQHKRGRMNVGIGGFSIDGPGRYAFAIETRLKGRWVEVHRFPLDVDARVQPEAGSMKKQPRKKRASRG